MNLKSRKRDYGFQKIEFNFLAQHSDFPKKLLSSTKLKKRVKNKKEIDREFENEKWGILRGKLSGKTNLKMEAIDSLYIDQDSVKACIVDGSFVLGRLGEFNQYIKDKIYEVVLKFLDEDTALVELGAGYGSKILGLSQYPKMKDTVFVAAEYTTSGVEVIKKAANNIGRHVVVGKCDFESLSIEGGLIPENSVIFTSYATHYVKKYSQELIDYFISFKPKAVIHIEPFYEHQASNNIHGLMSRRYFEINNYTLNQQGELSKAARMKKIKIGRTQYNILADNPFLPASIVEWKPL